MSRGIRRPGLLRAMVVAVTVVFAALTLVVGQGGGGEVITPIVGQVSPQTFVADAFVTVEDKAATAEFQGAARLNVDTRYREDPVASNAVISAVKLFFQRANEAGDPVVQAPLQPVEATTTSTTTTSTTTTTEVPPEGEEPQPAETTTTEVATTTTTLPPQPPPLEEQLLELSDSYPQLRPETLQIMLKIQNDDVARAQDSGVEYFLRVEEETLDIAQQVLDGGILSSDLEATKTALLRSEPVVFFPGLGEADRIAVQTGIANIVASFLKANLSIDSVTTDLERDAAAAAVPPQMIQFLAGENIVVEGAVVRDFHLDAIIELDLLEPAESTRLAAMATVAAITVLLAIFFLRRVAVRRWAQPKLVLLFGILIIAAALASRLPSVFPADRTEFGYLLPAAVFGFVATILFDSRTAALIAIPITAFTALTTGDVALAAFAAGATMAPVPFVSSVASRKQLRLAVLLTGAVLAPFGAAIAWFFSGFDLWWKAASMAFANGIASGVIAIGILPFLETTFRITTTLTLLDLTDRNHPALRLIEEEAPGTFNHSIMVGTLAGKAARAIGANPLLAQAAAYYHDLGKTVRPQFFIENQFGVSNPHDEMDPTESADVIRSHVADGLRLARQHGIPPDVAQGILMHHGTGLMRFFYHKAVEGDPATDPELFRHEGERPQAKEMAILMLSDAVEGATRALVQHEDPTSGGIRKVVDQVVAEKFEDNQLDESSLTFGELTKVKDALVEALIGYYHTRIPYPGFPGRSPHEEVLTG